MEVRAGYYDKQIDEFDGDSESLSEEIIVEMYFKFDVSRRPLLASDEF